MRTAIGVDLGGTNIRAAVITEDGKILRRVKEKTGLISSVFMLVEKIKRLVASLQAADFFPTAIAIAACGPVDGKKGYVFSLPNLNLQDIPLKQLLEASFSLPVYILNDADAAGYAEALFGAGKNYRRVQYLTISTGVGGAFVVDKKLYEGKDGLAMEIGHVVLRPDSLARQSANTNQGSFESLCSGTAIAARAINAGLNVSGAREVFFAAQKNETAQKVLDEWTNDLSLALANIFLTLAPDVYVFGGGVALSIEPYFASLKKKTARYLTKKDENDLVFVLSEFGDDSGLIGAGIYALKKLDAPVIFAAR